MAIVINPGTDEPSAYWKLNETWGNRVDETASGLDLTRYNKVGYAPGIQDSFAAKFDSSKTQWLGVTDSLGYITFGAPEQDMSIGFWFKPFNVTANQRMISKWHVSGQGEYIVDIFNNKLRYVVRATNLTNYIVYADDFGTLENNKWYFAAAYFDSFTNKIGVGCNDVWTEGGGPPSTAAIRGDTSEPLQIGRQNTGTNYYDGLIDDVWIFKGRLFTPEEFRWMYYYGYGHIPEPRTTSPATPIMTKPATPTLHWSFDEISGNRVGDVIGDATETFVSGNSPGVIESFRKLGKTTRPMNAVNFVRTSSNYLRCDNNALTTLGGPNWPFEIGFWVQPHEVATASKLVSKWDSGTSREYTVNINASLIRFAVSDYTDTLAYQVDASDFGTLTNGEWYYVHVYYDDGTNKIGVGVNNVFTEANGPTNGTYGDTNNELHIARDHNITTDYFDGYIDYLAIWRTQQLTTDERTWLYNHGFGRSWTDQSAPALPTRNVDKSYPTPELRVKILAQSEGWIDSSGQLYRENLQYVGVIDDLYSLSWTERYNDVNDFELEIPIEYMEDPKIVFGNIISVNNSDRLMVIEDMKVVRGESKTSLVVTGRGIEAYLERRVLRWSWTYEGPVETLLYWLVEENMIFPTNSARKIEVFDRGSGYVWPPAMLQDGYIAEQIENQGLLEAIMLVCNNVGYGWKIVPIDIDGEDTELYFHIYKGKDLSITQTDNNPVIFADKYDNVVESSLFHTDKGVVNSPLVITDDSVEDLQYVFAWMFGNRYNLGASEPIDIYRRESIIETGIDRDSDGDGTDDLTDLEVGELITAIGREESLATLPIKIFDGEFDAASTFIYGTDYDLGDIIQCRLHGQDVRARIIEVVRSYSIEGQKVYMAFDFIE